jgi:hypothetical protein
MQILDDEPQDLFGTLLLTAFVTVSFIFIAILRITLINNVGTTILVNLRSPAFLAIFSL